MKTEELVTLLAAGIQPVDRHAVGRAYGSAILSGLLGAAALMFALLGVRHDLLAATALPMFWGKIAFVAALGAAGLFATQRLSRPGARLDFMPWFLAAPVAVMWVIAAYVLSDAEPAQRMPLLLGATWTRCPWLIAMLSIPAFLAAMNAMRGLAPTRPRLAGAAAGLLAGTVGALVYCLHCPEMGAPFIASWYLLGILIPAAVGAAAGDRLLRW
jgi:hypothetical protein